MDCIFNKSLSIKFTQHAHKHLFGPASRSSHFNAVIVCRPHRPTTTTSPLPPMRRSLYNALALASPEAMPRTRASKSSPPTPPPTKKEDLNNVFPTPSLTDQRVRMSYEIARGEQGVLTFEPYKSILLPHWRFRTVPIAEESSKTLKGAFDHYVDAGDFVGSDMARKFIQMGMTRAKRYANHASGKKYAESSLILERALAARTGQPVGNPNHSKLARVELPKSTGHAGQAEKLAASEIFKVLWRECTSDVGYLKLKEEWQREKKAWVKSGGVVKKEEGIWRGYEVDGGRQGKKRKKGESVKEEESADEKVKTEDDMGVEVKKENEE